VGTRKAEENHVADLIGCGGAFSGLKAAGKIGPPGTWGLEAAAARVGD